MSSPDHNSLHSQPDSHSSAHLAGWSNFTRFATYATVVIIAILIVLAAVFVHRTTGAHPTT